MTLHPTRHQVRAVKRIIDAVLELPTLSSGDVSAVAVKSKNGQLRPILHNLPRNYGEGSISPRIEGPRGIGRMTPPDMAPLCPVQPRPAGCPFRSHEKGLSTSKAMNKTAERYRGRARRATAKLEIERAKVEAVRPKLSIPAPTGTLPDFYAWAESTLIVPTGPLRGEPFKVYQWQRDFLDGALADGIREAGLSVARKNGKTGVIAALVLGYLVGPLRTPLWRGIVVSLTGLLAGELRRAIVETAEASGLESLLKVRKAPPPGSITGLDGAEITLLASDKGSGHAVGADLAIIDEAGLIPESQRELWGAVLSSTSGRDGRLLGISIRGDGPMFAELRERRDSPAVFYVEHAADEGAALDDPQQWHKANPGLGVIKSMDYMRDAASRAIQTPSDASIFRAYDLNDSLNPTRIMLCDPSEWAALEADDLPPREGPYVLGFDIGGSSSLTAAFAIWRNGRVETWAACGDTPTLLERGRADGVGGRYVDMERRGELRTYPGRVTPVDAFLADVALELRRPPLMAGADRYRRAEVLDFLEKAGLKWPMEWRGQGASAVADGSHDVRALQRMVYAGLLKVRPSLMLRSAIAESELRFDTSGNPALSKARNRGRIDALQAGVIAAGLWESHLSGPPPRARYRSALV